MPENPAACSCFDGYVAVVSLPRTLLLVRSTEALFIQAMSSELLKFTTYSMIVLSRCQIDMSEILIRFRGDSGGDGHLLCITLDTIFD